MNNEYLKQLNELYKASKELNPIKTTIENEKNVYQLIQEIDENFYNSMPIQMCKMHNQDTDGVLDLLYGLEMLSSDNKIRRIISYIEEHAIIK